MILSHFTALVIFALIVSTVFALITKNEPREQFRYGLFVFLSFIAVAFAVGWLMYPLPLSGYRP
jgi:hypothetical protein